MRRIALTLCLLLIAWCASPAHDTNGHTHFVGIPLNMPLPSLADQLSQHGMRITDSTRLDGQIAGLDVCLTLHSRKDSARVSAITLSTQQPQGRTVRDDYRGLMQWMRQHYGAPAWESTVRGHQFARWYIGFDRDIVMIATAKQSVEIWFYDDHSKRNPDYYAILKYCERNPSADAPQLTARECVTWHESPPPSAIRKHGSRHRYRHHKATKRRKAKKPVRRRR